jgi:thiamine pyrophosphokinase
MKKKAIIICGGILEEDFVLETIKACEPDCIIAVDKGLEFLYKHNIVPDAIVGDFDSVSDNVISHYVREIALSIYQHTTNKESSDTELAMEVAIELEQEELLILGATGKRLDHFWGNVQSLKIPLDAGVKAMILDSMNRIRLLNKDFVLVKEQCFGNYISIFPLGAIVENVSLEGAKYPLKNESLTPWNSRFISNEITEEELRITFQDGIIVLMETKD